MSANSFRYIIAFFALIAFSLKASISFGQTTYREKISNDSTVSYQQVPVDSEVNYHNEVLTKAAKKYLKKAARIKKRQQRREKRSKTKYRTTQTSMDRKDN